MALITNNMAGESMDNEQEISHNITSLESANDVNDETIGVETDDTQEEAPIPSEITETERELTELEQELKEKTVNKALDRILATSVRTDDEYRQWQPIAQSIADNPFFSPEENAVRTRRIKAQKAECERILNETIVPFLGAKQEEALEQISSTIAQIENVRIEEVKLVEKRPLYTTLGEALYRFGKRDYVLPALQEIAKNKCANEAPEKRELFIQAVSKLVQIDVERKESISEIVKHNLALVLFFAKKNIPHANNPRAVSLSLFDLFNEGSIGCTRGVDTYDPDTGYKLSSYITWWIKQAIETALSQQGMTVRDPRQVTDMARNIRKAEAALMQELGRFPTSSEIAERTGFTESAVLKQKVMHSRGLLDEPLREDARPLQIADKAPGPLEQLLSSVERERLREAIQSLPHNERKVLLAIYYADPDRVLSFKEVGERAKEFDIVGSKGKKTRANGQLSHETIRKMANLAIGKLKEMLKET